MQQKVIQIGNSMGVVIPQTIAKDTFRIGDVVEVDKSSMGDVIITKPGNAKASPVTPEFLSWLEAFNKKYKKGLTELAKK